MDTASETPQPVDVLARKDQQIAELTETISQLHSANRDCFNAGVRWELMYRTCAEHALGLSAKKRAALRKALEWKFGPLTDE